MSNKVTKSIYLHKQDEWKRLYESGMSFKQIGKLEGVHYSTVQRVLKGVVESRPKLKYAQLSKKWVELYVRDGHSTSYIADKYEVDACTVSSYLKREGVMLRKDGPASPNAKYFHLWASEYESGKSLTEIADAYEVSPSVVGKHIKDRVKIRTYTETSQVYKIEHPDYFNVIDSHEKAYWLGIWYGTGSLHQDIGTFECTLAVGVKDRIIAERFKEKIGFDKPITEDRKNEASHVVRLRIHNKMFFDNLVKHGIDIDKLTNMKMPPQLPEAFYNSFILGLYESKGSCAISDFKRKGIVYNRILFQLYANKELLLSLKEIIHERTGVNLPIHRFNKGATLGLESASRDNIEILANWLYSGRTTHTEHRDIRTLLKQM